MKVLPRMRYRRRVYRDLVRCFLRSKPTVNPTRRLCEEAAYVIVALEYAIESMRKKK